MFDRYEDFDIRVSRLDAERYAVEVSGTGGDGRGALVLPTANPLYQALAARLASLDTDEATLIDLGQLLFKSLFEGEIHDIYAQSRAMLAPNVGLRIVFHFDVDEIDIAALPWEFLCDPKQIGPMATLDTPIVRYLSQSVIIPRLETGLPLKVLLTGAATEPKTDVTAALADVQAALGKLGYAMAVTVEPHLTRQKFQQLLHENFHIWHFIGHGAPASESRSGALLFEDAQGDAERMSARELGILLNRNNIRLVVLNACDTAKLTIDPFQSVAPALLKAQIPGVIAMQLRVSQEAARAFSAEFYRTLAAGYPLDACVTEGRKAVIGCSGLRNPDWGIPVVYTRAKSGRLFELPAATEPVAIPVLDRRVADPKAETPRRRATDRPGPPPPDRRLINLPAKSIGLIGRDADVVEARALLLRDDVRLITLIGPGGIGKTRLAIAIATSLEGSFDHGICFVDLAPISQTDQVIPTIARTLKIEESRDLPLLETLQAYLRERQMLLVLDNFEQLLEAGHLIAELLTAAPRLEVLVTSRAALWIEVEHVFLVKPLELPTLEHLPSITELHQKSAVALFVERARAATGRFDLTPANAQAIAEICVQLDGLPLAIELAAARCKMLNPQTLLKHLSDRLGLLTGGPRDLVARQQTLRNTIEWSYNLLNDEQKSLFARLSVFVGSCTQDGVEQICTTQVAVGGAQYGVKQPFSFMGLLNTMGSLVDQSLLRRIELEDADANEASHGDSADDERYAMLETVRDYARERLRASDEADQITRRHATYYLALAEAAEPELTGAQQKRWLARIDADLFNFDAALSWWVEHAETEPALRLVGAIWRFWYIRGRLSEGRALLERALASAAGLTSADGVLAKALNGAAGLAWAQGDYAPAQQHYEASLALCRTLNDTRGIARALNNLGTVANSQSDHERAGELFEQALPLFRALNDDLNVANLLSNLGVRAHECGDDIQARALHAEGLAIRRRLNDTARIAISLINLGVVSRAQGDAAYACACYHEALQLADDLDDQESVVTSIEGVAFIAADAAHYEIAAQLLAAADHIRTKIELPLPLSERRHYEQAVAAIRARFGDAWKTAWEAGHALSIAQAIKQALAVGYTSGSLPL